jgi:hypothetical protein
MDRDKCCDVEPSQRAILILLDICDDASVPAAFLSSCDRESYRCTALLLYGYKACKYFRYLHLTEWYKYLSNNQLPSPLDAT